MEECNRKMQECADYAIKVVKGELGEKWLSDSFAELCDMAKCSNDREKMHIVAQAVAIRAIHALDKYQLTQPDMLLDSCIDNGHDDRRGLRI